MTKEEIEFLISAGFTVDQIMKMIPVQNDGNTPGSSSGSAPAAGQNAQNGAAAPAEPAAAPAEPAAAPAEPAAAPAPAAVTNEDQSSVIIAKLDSLIAAVQASNRASSSITPPVKLSPEEIAGKLI